MPKSCIAVRSGLGHFPCASSGGGGCHRADENVSHGWPEIVAAISPEGKVTAMWTMTPSGRPGYPKQGKSLRRCWCERTKQPASDGCHALCVCPRTNARSQSTASAQGPGPRGSSDPGACPATALEEVLSASLLAHQKGAAPIAWAQTEAAHCTAEVVLVDEPLVAELEHPINEVDGPAV